ncbi:linker histone H1M [Labrus bergylta]|uniref:Linker histone H1M n=1 Tax=Labrus bergylta TaxID=56723 RepID=A0A3Q3E3I8_9LABR|nr:protein B4 [Labrus bergylta]
MPPKKTVVDSAAAPVSSSDDPVEEKVETKTDAAALRKLAAHPSTAIMVREALKELDSRKGVSSVAIQNYIKQKYPSVDLVRLKTLVRKALKKGIETGTLVRPANATVTTGATGKFRLAPEVKETKAKTENADPNVQKVPKAAKDGATKPKKAGTTKKKANASEDAKTKEDSKPPKKSKKDEEAPTLKSAPAKKPKAKKATEEADGDETAVTAKTKAVKTTKEEVKTTKEVKASRSKAAKADSDAPAPKAPAKRGKKTAE